MLKSMVFVRTTNDEICFGLVRWTGYLVKEIIGEDFLVHTPATESIKQKIIQEGLVKKDGF